MHARSCSGKGEKSQMRVLTWCHPTGTKTVCFSLHTCCHVPKKHELIFHLHFLTISQPIGTGTEDPSKVSFSIVLTFGLETLQNQAEQNLSPCKHRARMKVCGWLCRSACVPHATETLLWTPWAEMLSPVFWVWYLLRAFFFVPQKNFLDNWKWQKGDATSLRLHLRGIMLQSTGKHHCINPMAEGAEAQVFSTAIRR